MRGIQKVFAAAAVVLAASAWTPQRAIGAPAAVADGTLAGSRIYTFYGFVRVDAVVSKGALTDVKVREYPNHSGTSRRINDFALPYLIREAVSAQSAGIDAVSGATITSEAFAQSLDSALSKGQR